MCNICNGLNPNVIFPRSMLFHVDCGNWAHVACLLESKDSSCATCGNPIDPRETLEMAVGVETEIERTQQSVRNENNLPLGAPPLTAESVDANVLQQIEGIYPKWPRNIEHFNYCVQTKTPIAIKINGND